MRFNLGSQVITANARSILIENDVHVALVRHSKCDYGNVCEDIMTKQLEQKTAEYFQVIKHWMEQYSGL